MISILEDINHTVFINKRFFTALKETNILLCKTVTFLLFIVSESILIAKVEISSKIVNI